MYKEKNKRNFKNLRIICIQDVASEIAETNQLSFLNVSSYCKNKKCVGNRKVYSF